MRIDWAKFTEDVNEGRRAGCNNEALAKRMGLPLRTLVWRMHFARRNGYDVEMPPPRPALWREAAARLQAGEDPATIPDSMGIHKYRLSALLAQARNYSDEFVPRLNPPATAKGTLLSLHRAGGGLPFGQVTAALDEQPREFGRWLLAQAKPQDKNVAAILVRLARERLYDTR
jgi:hypothetical protein